jgi:phospholipid/cholesterol/gamma-HCH transport system substrate-binding protein
MLMRRFPLRTLLLGVAALLVLALLAQALRQGLFEAHNDYILTAARAGGVRPGVGVEYAGFEIGRVQGVSLGPDGQVEISIRVSRKYQELVRADSQFALEQPIVGVPRIVVEPTAKRESPLPSGSTRTLRTTKQLDQIMEKGMAVAEQIRALLSADSVLSKTLGNVQALTASMKEKGMLRPALGDDAAAEAILVTLRQSATAVRDLQNALAGVQRVAGDASTTAAAATQTLRNMDSAVAQAREKALGTGGTLARADATLAEAAKSLQAVQATLQELQKTLGNTTRASGDAADAAEGLGELRTRVDSISRNIDGMLLDLKRLGPFSKEGEARLP